MTIMDVTGITLVPTFLGTYTLTLPSIILNDAGIIPGKTYVIRDKDGNANSNPITINAGTIPGFSDPQYFSDGSTTIYITQPFGFVTVVEQSLGVYGIISNSDYPQGSTDQLVEVLNISTGTVVSNLKLQDTEETSPQQYKLFVSAGSLFVNTIESSNPQSNVELLQLTTNQYQSTFSSIAELFTPSTINASYVSSFSIYTYLMYVSSLFTNQQTIGQITNETGQLSTIVTIANTVNTLFLSSGYISTGWISSMDGSFGNLNTSNIQTNNLIGSGNTTMNLVIANEISSATVTIMNTLASGNVSTNTIQMRSLNTNPAIISSLYTTDVSSLRANISTISTANIEVAGRILSGLSVYRTSTIATNAISANTMYVGSGNISTFQFSTVLSDQSYGNNLITSTINTNTLSSGMVMLNVFTISSLRANTISTNGFQASQINISSLTANALTISTVNNRFGTISTIQANTLSTGYLSAASAFFSTMSTSFYSTVSSFGLVANIEALSTNVLSTFQLNIGAGSFRSTITSTIAAGYIPSTSIGRISTVNVDFISTRFLVMSTISTIVGDSYVVRTSTLRNTVGGPLPNISAGYATIKTICTLNVSLQVPAIPTTNYLSAGLMNVGYLMVSTIARTIGSMSTGLMTTTTCDTTQIQASTLVDNYTIISKNNRNPIIIVGGGNAFGTGYTPIKISTDNGNTWSNAGGTFTTYGRAAGYNPNCNTYLMTGFGTNTLNRSIDGGITWSAVTGTYGDKGILYANNIWVNVGDYNNSANRCFRKSTDNGLTWDSTVPDNFFFGTGTYCYDIAYNSNVSTWVAVGIGAGSASLRSTILYSTDNTNTWNPPTSYTRFSVNGGEVVTNNKIFVAGGKLSAAGNACLQYSTNGTNWLSGNISGVNCGAISWSPKLHLWIAIIDNNVVYSSDGISWTPTVFSFEAQKSAWCGDKFIMVGFAGTSPYNNMYSSSNGIDWDVINGVTFNDTATSTAYDIFYNNITTDIDTNTMYIRENYTDEPKNSIISYTSAIAFNDTLYIQQNINEVGINQINPVATLDINSTIRAVNETITISTINVNRISAPIINVDTLSISARISTRQSIFSTLISDNISTGFMNVNTLTVNQLLINSNFNQLSSGVYEGGGFRLRSLSTNQLRSDNIFTAGLSTNTISTINYLVELPQTSSMQVRRIANVQTLNTDKISTNITRSYGDIYASTISTSRISSVFGYFSTVAIGGTFDPAYALNVSGIINATYQVTVNGNALTSDSNVKTNIELADLDRCYNTMESLPLKRFTYLPEYSQGTQDKTQLGFIAQEVQEVFPKSIFSIPSGPSGQDILHLTFDQLFINSYGATQKLMTIVEERQNIISTLYSTVESLQSQVSTLKGNNV